MKIKFKDFKIDFTKRDTISMVCFTIVMVVILVLGNCFGFVSADEFYNFDSGVESADFWLNNEDWEDSSVYESLTRVGFSYSTNSENSLNESAITEFNNLVSNGISGFSSVDSYNNPIDYSSFDAYIITNNNLILYNSSTTKAFFVNFSNADRIFLYSSGRDSYCCTFSLSYTNGAYVVSSSLYDEVYDGYLPEGLSSKCLKQVAIYQGYKLSNAPIYCFLEEQYFSSYQDLLDGFDGGSYADSNYLLYDGGVTPSEGSGLGGGGSSSGETSINNLYMNNPFWVFSMPSYSSSNKGNIIKNNGTATFNATMTNYQLENSDDFNLHFTFEITVKYTADGGWSGGSHGFWLLGSTNLVNRDTGSTVSRTGVFKYRPSGGSSTFSELSLEHFNGSYSFNTITNYRYIFGNCYLDGDTSKESFLNWYTTNYNSSSVQFSSIVLKCTSELFDSNMNYSSPCIYQYDFVSGTSSKLADGMGTNNNPYDYQNQDSYSDSVSGGYGYVTQNNNQTVTITNSNVNSNDISNVIGDIGDDQDSDSLINKFSTLLSLSSWVAVFASAMSFVPVAFWTNLVEYFAVALGILSTFLVLRYILNLLT